MRIAKTIAASFVMALMGVLAACGSESERAKAEKKEAKKERDKELLALEYPGSTGTQPRTIEIIYDAAGDRTTMTLRLEGLRAAGSPQVSAATLHMTSSHKGRVRAPDNPEGSADGSLVVQTASPGVLAYSGTPGTVAFDGQSLPLREASGKERYFSAKASGGREEVRFRLPTEISIAAAKSSGFTLSIGTIRLEVSGAQLADFREFVARMNPKP